MLARAVFIVLDTEHPRAKERLGRKYTLIIQSDKTTHTLTVFRSGLERSPTAHGNVFESRDELLANAREKIMRRFSHGYTLTWWDEDFPFMDWIVKRGYQRERMDMVPPPVQLYLPISQRKTRHLVGENY